MGEKVPSVIKRHQDGMPYILADESTAWLSCSRRGLREGYTDALSGLPLHHEGKPAHWQRAYEDGRLLVAWMRGRRWTLEPWAIGGTMPSGIVEAVIAVAHEAAGRMP